MCQDYVYFVTLNLATGLYNLVIIVKNFFLKKNLLKNNKIIHIFNSKNCAIYCFHNTNNK